MSKDRLTKKQEEQLLDDFSLMVAIVMAQQEFLKEIGKFEESRIYVQAYINDLQKKEKKKVNQ